MGGFVINDYFFTSPFIFLNASVCELSVCHVCRCVVHASPTIRPLVGFFIWGFFRDGWLSASVSFVSNMSN